MAGSIWGAIQHTTVLKKGLKIVSTAGHGGVMVTSRYAEKHLSEAARKRGERYGNYLCYEEDCDMSIPLFESPDVWEKLWPDKDGHSILLSSLSRWNSDYLIEIGVEPDAEAYEEYLTNQKRRKMREERNGDLIIAAWSADELGKPGVIKVMTADDNIHYIMKEGYSEMRLKLLSKCQICQEEEKPTVRLKSSEASSIINLTALALKNAGQEENADEYLKESSNTDLVYLLELTKKYVHIA